ncbi:hypothetical protein [Parendozoicomonas haliclonae]
MDRGVTSVYSPTSPIMGNGGMSMPLNNTAAGLLREPTEYGNQDGMPMMYNNGSPGSSDSGLGIESSPDTIGFFQDSPLSPAPSIPATDTGKVKKAKGRADSKPYGDRPSRSRKKQGKSAAITRPTTHRDLETEILPLLLAKLPEGQRKVDTLSTMEVDDFNALIVLEEFSPAEEHDIIELRRRGKNKNAAQIARTKQRTEHEELDDEVAAMRKTKRQLEKQVKSLQTDVATHQRSFLQKVEAMYQENQQLRQENATLRSQLLGMNNPMGFHQY